MWKNLWTVASGRERVLSSNPDWKWEQVRGLLIKRDHNYHSLTHVGLYCCHQLEITWPRTSFTMFSCLWMQMIIQTSNNCHEIKIFMWETKTPPPPLLINFQPLELVFEVSVAILRMKLVWESEDRLRISVQSTRVHFTHPSNLWSPGPWKAW